MGQVCQIQGACYDCLKRMATEQFEIRMARLEGAYEQINERLGLLEQRLTSEIASLRLDFTELRRQINTQFYWLLTFVLGSILIPILRDLMR